MEALKIAEKIIRENAFEHEKKKPGLHLTPGSLSTNRPSNNWALGYILPLRLLVSLNVGFFGDWRDQTPQFMFVYYLWPKLSQMNDL